MQIHLRAPGPGPRNHGLIERNLRRTQLERIAHFPIQLLLINHQRNKPIFRMTIPADIRANNTPLDNLLGNLDPGRPIAPHRLLHVSGIDQDRARVGAEELRQHEAWAHAVSAEGCGEAAHTGHVAEVAAHHL